MGTSLKIQINAVSGITTKQGKFKPYSQYDIDFVDLESGRPRRKHMVDFNGPKAFEALKEAQVGQYFEIEEKPGKDPQYTDWTDATPITVEQTREAAAGPAVDPGVGVRATTFKSTYETPEERARKQVYIVRQSSIGHAIAFSQAGGTYDIEGLTTKDILNIAREFEAYVFGYTQDDAEPTVE